MPIVHPFSFFSEPSTAPPPALSNFSLLFNGSSQYVTLPGSPVDLDSDCTIECWGKVMVEGNNVIFAAQVDSNNYWIFIIRNDGNGLCVQYAIASASASFICAGAGTVTVADDWTYMALVRSGNDWEIYKDTGLFKSETNSATGFAASPQNIARLPTTSVYFSGYLDEIRVWNVARTEAELMANKDIIISPATPGLVAVWRFEDGAGTNASDELGTNDGTLVGTPTWSSDTPI